MRALRLFAWGLLGFALALFSGVAFAQDTYWRASISSGVATSDSADGACRAAFAIYATTNPGSTYGSTTAGANATRFNCNVKRASGSTFLGGEAVLTTCAASTPNFWGGKCNAGANPTPPDLCADKNPMVRRWNYPASGPYSTPGHFSGCVVTPMEMMVCRKDSAGSYCMWMVKRTGEKYSGPDSPGTAGSDAPEVPADPPVKSPPIESPPKADDPPGKGPCPAGTVHAGMSLSGIPMCIGTGSTPPAKPVQPKTETEKNETAADGTTTNTKTVITTNADGSTTKTVTVTVTKPDGTKTTSGTADTSATPAGAAGKADRPTEDDKYDLCKTNPNLSVCREGSVTGTCGQIQCVGDAVQCATLRAAAAMECRGKADEDALKALPQTALGNSILSGADPMKAKIEETMKGTEIDLSKPGLDETGFIGGGSCLPNKTMTVMGRSVTVEFGQLCTNIQPLRGVVMACAFILAYMIVSRSVLQG